MTGAAVSTAVSILDWRRSSTGSDDRHFEAGVMAFSPVLRFEELLDKLDSNVRAFANRPRRPASHDSRTDDPQGLPRSSGSLRNLIACELHRSRLANPEVERDAIVREDASISKPVDGDKLQSARVRC